MLYEKYLEKKKKINLKKYSYFLMIKDNFSRKMST